MRDETKHSDPPRQRLMLCVPARPEMEAPLGDALAAGDVAAVVLWSESDDEATMQAGAKGLVAAAQAHGAAVLLRGSTRVAGRLGADGVQVEGNEEALRDVADRYAGRGLLGAGNLRSRHAAMVAGEFGCDYAFFGRADGDTHPEPHAKNVALARWWAELMELPGVIMGGNDLASLDAAIDTGVEFVALGRAVLDHADGPGRAVEAAERSLRPLELAA